MSIDEPDASSRARFVARTATGGLTHGTGPWLTAYSKRACRTLLQALLPWLNVKRTEAVLALWMLTRMESRRRYHPAPADYLACELSAALKKGDRAAAERGVAQLVGAFDDKSVVSWAWLAGFFDGDGSVSVSRSADRQLMYIQASVENTFEPSLYDAQGLFAEPIAPSVREKKRAKVTPRIGGRLVETNRQMHRLIASNRPAVANWLSEMSPHLVAKKVQAELALRHLGRACRVRKYEPVDEDWDIYRLVHQLNTGTPRERATATAEAEAMLAMS